jgi:hypothetical protein
VSVALVGLVGVIAGALLGGLMSFRLERSKQLMAARVARSLIVAELEGATIRMTSAVTTGKWFSLKLPTETWREMAGALSPAIDDDLGQRLSDAYGQIEVWNAEKTFGVIAGQQRDELKADRDSLQKYSKQLREATLKPRGLQLQKPARIGVLVAAVAVATALSMTALAPRPNLTDETVAAALQAKLGEKAMVACVERDGGWSCEASAVREPQRTCPSHVAARSRGAARSELASFVKVSRCSKVPVEYVVAEGAEDLVATQSPSEVERAIRRQRWQVDEPEKSWAARVVDFLF